jgi:hypothetical protein
MKKSIILYDVWIEWCKKFASQTAGLDGNVARFLIYIIVYK